MALDSKQLAKAIQLTFDSAAAEGWSTEQVADGLAQAIDDYVRRAEVQGVETKLELDVPNNTGSGAQVGSVPLQ